MTLKPADMSSCNKKERCVFGDNEGVAYTPGDECFSGFSFSPEVCDCVAICSTQWRTAVVTTSVTDIGCGGSCVYDGDPVFGSETIISLPTGYGQYVGTFNHQSISGECPSGPVNCGLTPVDYGVEAIYYSNGNLYLAADDEMQCGVVDQLFAIFQECNTENPSSIGVLLAAGGGGASECMLDMFILSHMEPYTP